jgi:hypothetical protein
MNAARISPPWDRRLPKGITTRPSGDETAQRVVLSRDVEKRKMRERESGAAASPPDSLSEEA